MELRFKRLEIEAELKQDISCNKVIIKINEYNLKTIMLDIK